MFRLICCVCLLFVLVKSNPVPQHCPDAYCDQISYRNSLADLSDTVIPNFVSPLNGLTEYEKSKKIDKIHKLFYERLANNPSALGVIKNIQRLNDEDILDYLKNSGKIPNIVNNYIFLPTDVKAESVLKPKIVDIARSNENKIKHDLTKKIASKHIASAPCDNIDKITHERKTQITDIQQNIVEKECILENKIEANSNIEDNIRRTLKRSLEEKHKTEGRDNVSSHHNKTINMENKVYPKKKRKSKSKQSSDKILSEKDINADNTVSNKDINHTHDKHNANQNHGSKVKKTVKNIKNGESVQKKRTKEKTQNKDGNKQNNRKKSERKDKTVQNDNPSVQNDFNDMYNKYIETLLSNYQLTNTNFSSGFPFDYNNFYQLSQPTSPWNSINTINNKVVPHKRRKLQRLHGKRINRNKAKLKKKQKERKVDDSIKVLNNNNNLSKDIMTSDKKEESVSLTDKILSNKSMISLEEADNNLTRVIDEPINSNNSLTEDFSQYNSYPSFIIGVEDAVPIIFEDGFIDDYYPDFTADNKALLMTPEENYAKMYNSEKYRYVSNLNLELEDDIKKRKEIAMNNINTNTKLFFSEKATNGDVIVSEEDVIDNEGGRMIKFQSPPLLDNPDFRTRKIESNEKYEPYYYQNVFHDPDEDFDKYYSEKKEIVYPTSYSLKNNVKNKLCNEIDDSTSKAKWKKVKDSDVETVYARSKLAKYGQVS